MPDVRIKKEGAVKNTSSAMRRLASRKEACFFWLAKKQADRLLLSNAYSFLGGCAGEPFFGSCKERFPRTYFILFFHSPFIPGAFTKPFAPLNEGRPALHFHSYRPALPGGKALRVPRAAKPFCKPRHAGRSRSLGAKRVKRAHSPMRPCGSAGRAAARARPDRRPSPTRSPRCPAPAACPECRKTGCARPRW